MFNSLKKILWDLHFKFPVITKFIYLHNGFDIKREELEKDPRDLHLGATPKPIINESGNHHSFMPKGERQKGRDDSYSCTNQTVNNCLEGLAKEKYGIGWNRSDSFNAKLSGTVPGRGNSARNAINSPRKYHGTIPEADRPLPIEFTNAQFYAPVTQEQKATGQIWLKEWKVEYRNVSANANALMSALKEGIIAVAVYAWYKDKKTGMYLHYGKHNHYTTLVGFKDGEYWEVFDSYPDKDNGSFYKKLPWNYPFVYCRVIYLDKKKKEFNQEAINKLKQRKFDWILLPQKNGEVWELLENGMRYVSPEEWNKKNVEEKAHNEKLIGVTNELFYSLFK